LQLLRLYIRKHKKGSGKDTISSELADEKKTAEESPPNLKLTDKLWVAVVIAIFVVAFLLIVIYDVI